jgi:hypothetical protein
VVWGRRKKSTCFWSGLYALCFKTQCFTSDNPLSSEKQVIAGARCIGQEKGQTKNEKKKKIKYLVSSV